MSGDLVWSPTLVGGDNGCGGRKGIVLPWWWSQWSSASWPNHWPAAECAAGADDFHGLQMAAMDAVCSLREGVSWLDLEPLCLAVSDVGWCPVNVGELRGLLMAAMVGGVLPMHDATWQRWWW